MKIIKSDGKRIDLKLERNESEVSVIESDDGELLLLLAKVVSMMYQNGLTITDPDLLNLLKYI